MFENEAALSRTGIPNLFLGNPKTLPTNLSSLKFKDDGINEFICSFPKRLPTQLDDIQLQLYTEILDNLGC